MWNELKTGLPEFLFLTILTVIRQLMLSNNTYNTLLNVYNFSVGILKIYPKDTTNIPFSKISIPSLKINQNC